MSVSLHVEGDLTSWRVISFNNDHNHELLDQREVRYLPAYRSISEYYRSRLLTFATTGMCVKEMMRLLEIEQQVKVGCLPFTQKDVRNFLNNSKNIDRDNDATKLVLMCKKMKDNDDDFKYDYTVDGENKLEHIPWSHGTSIHASSDVAFLKFMNEKAPQTILTDQDLGLKEAIASEMPNTKHALCIWHIVSKFSGWFSTILGVRYNDWKTDFYRLYELESEDEFITGWFDMVNKYDLHTNRHIHNLYALREYWAKPYVKSFFAGMTTTGRSESINSFIKRFVSAQTLLTDFIERVSVAVELGDQVGEQQTMQQKYFNVNLKTATPIEEHASKVLTPYAFELFQQEIVAAFQYVTIQIGVEILLKNNYFETPEQYLPIRWRREIPLPQKYSQDSPHGYKKRYQVLQSIGLEVFKESAKSGERFNIAYNCLTNLFSNLKEMEPISIVEDIEVCDTSNDLEANLVDIPPTISILNPNHSITKGRPNEKRPKGGVELAKKPRYCKVPTCGKTGHDKRNCPELKKLCEIEEMLRANNGSRCQKGTDVPTGSGISKGKIAIVDAPTLFYEVTGSTCGSSAASSMFALLALGDSKYRYSRNSAKLRMSFD
ncbi:hypothetical protein HHK36_011992 [Tetracentron sinense]|uniref:Protein FAR1-RELATED SEQUENCE n=1 Tax=Tetracentron sinense TaxID=13715 RepID=A0A834ZCH8_TETSI|nr:hypothetical protein HHK36_011992 [Tetracentron sinense]